jgi:acyl carrier protein
MDMGIDISEYGMDSINIMFVVAEVREKFGLQREPKDIVDHRTLAERARYVAACSNGSAMGMEVGG